MDTGHRRLGWGREGNGVPRDSAMTAGQSLQLEAVYRRDFLKKVKLTD